MKKILFVFPVVVFLAAGCNSSSQTKTQSTTSDTGQQKNNASTLTSKLAEFKRLSPVSTLVPSYIPTNYEFYVSPNNSKDFPSFDLNSNDQNTQIEITQFPITQQDLAAKDSWVQGYPRLFAPVQDSIKVSVGTQMGYFDGGPEGRVGRLISIKDNVVIKAYAIVKTPVGRESLISELIAIVASMK